MQTQLRKKVSDAIRSANAVSLIDLLFENPAITTSNAASKLGITYPAAKHLIDRLSSLDILTEVPKSYPKTFLAWEIFLEARQDS
jgi:DNA-binding MarR family transcriptional regulator